MSLVEVEVEVFVQREGHDVVAMDVSSGIRVSKLIDVVIQKLLPRHGIGIDQVSLYPSKPVEGGATVSPLSGLSRVSEIGDEYSEEYPLRVVIKDGKNFPSHQLPSHLNLTSHDIYDDDDISMIVC